MLFSNNNQFQVGQWTVRPKENLIVKGKTSRQLESRVMDVLVFLSQHNDSAVTIKQIQQAVWQQQVVSNSAVYRVIAELRKALESGSDVQYVKTINKRGYSLVQPVTNKKANMGLFALIVLFLVAFSLMLYPLISDRKGDSFAQYIFEPATSMPGREFHPALHPTGSLLAFISQENEHSKSEIYAQLLNDPASYSTNKETFAKAQQRSFPLIRSSHHNYHSPSWSYDGRKITYAQSNNDSCDIFIATFDHENLSISNPKNVATCDTSPPESLQFTFDDQHIAYNKVVNGKASILLTSLESSESSIVLPINDEGLSWNYQVLASPYENKLIVLRYKNYQETIFYLYDIKTKLATEFYIFPSIIPSISWGDSENTIVFKSKQNTYHKVNINTGEISQFLQTTHRLGNLNKAAESNTFSFEQFASSPLSIKVKSINGETSTNYTDITSSYTESYPEFAHHSETLAFVSNRSGSNQLWQKKQDGKIVQLTQFKEDGWMGKLRWSKDDKKIVFARARNIYIYNFESQSAGLILSAALDETLFGPTWSSDNQHIFYNRLADDKFYLYKLTLNSATKKPEIISQDILNYQQDSNKEFAYFTSSYQDGLFRTELATGKKELVIPEVKISTSNAWRLNETGVYFLDSSGDRSYIKYKNLKTGETTHITDWNKPIARSFSIDHHNKMLAHDDYSYPNSDIIIYKQTR